MNQKYLVFTGTLSTMTRKQAQALVVALGGESQTSVTKQTTHLVIGASRPTLFDESHSFKYQMVEKMKNDGQTIQCIDERAFLEGAITELQRRVRNL
ncbi:BRCT domain-containing protein [Enterococcus sp. 5B3_DIV0040]|uniref:BRCT domain-containing protein n=1 Tax=Enterococcus sp. 5B3_DIV0040 TaxID=1834182 RepID=UPI000A34DA36|nr:BRCT domain-containing protein [Enterococcus sp. 5B3_DIV0040]OTO02272.1 hypothetical protein A5883_003099 [Enterococcus sp. 5B3_DIV0040]